MKETLEEMVQRIIEQEIAGKQLIDFIKKNKSFTVVSSIKNPKNLYFARTDTGGIYVRQIIQNRDSNDMAKKSAIYTVEKFLKLFQFNKDQDY